MKSDTELFSELSKSGRMHEVIEQAICEMNVHETTKAFYRKNKFGLKHPLIRRQVLLILGRTEK